MYIFNVSTIGEYGSNKELSDSLTEFVKKLNYEVNHTHNSLFSFEIKVKYIEGELIDSTPLKIILYNKLLMANLKNLDVNITTDIKDYFILYKVKVDWLHLKYEIPLSHKYLVTTVDNIYKSIVLANAIGHRAIWYPFKELIKDNNTENNEVLVDSFLEMGFNVKVNNDMSILRIEW